MRGRCIPDLLGYRFQFASADDRPVLLWYLKSPKTKNKTSGHLAMRAPGHFSKVHLVASLHARQGHAYTASAD